MRWLCVYAIFALHCLWGTKVGVPQIVESQLHEKFVESQGSVAIRGQDFSYTATAGDLILQDEQEKDKGSIFFVAYHLTNPPQGTRRPLMFCMNGGPGSSATWLHLGLLGPKRIVCDEQGLPLSPPQLVNNEYCLLDLMDLVFVDPISTGFSRAAAGESAKQFHGVEEDAKWIGEFIRLYLSRFGGWDGPLYFVGESYGTTRAGILASKLIDRQRIYLDRIFLISSVLNYQTLEFTFGNDLPYLLALPSYVSAAWHYKKLPEEQQKKSLVQILNEIENFSTTDYNIALMKGDRLTKEEKNDIISKLTSYTGISEDFWNLANLRVPVNRFRRELLRSEVQTIGRFDSRYAGQALVPQSSLAEYDPSFDALFGPFNAAINEYLRRDLHWNSSRNYELLANIWPWKFGSVENRYLDVSEDLREAMIRNPRLKVYVASGIYDLAIPYFATKYTFDHLGMKDRVSLHYYEAGHMMYLQLPILQVMTEQMREFLK